MSQHLIAIAGLLVLLAIVIGAVAKGFIDARRWDQL